MVRGVQGRLARVSGTNPGETPESTSFQDSLNMRAIRMTGHNREPELVEIPIPTPGPGEVLVRVDAAGLCHSDLHLMEWPAEIIPYELPFTLGHETAGTVAALGPGADGVYAGDRVIVYARWGCGRCQACLQGLENRCEKTAVELGGHGGGVGRDGGLAEYMLVPSARYLIGIDGLDPARAAPLTDAALTPYHAIRRCSHHLVPGATALVIGIGGIGHMAVQLLRALSSVRIVAVDVREDALELARSAGADLAVSAAGLEPAELRLEIGARGATVVLDCVASELSLALAAGAVAVGGEISYIGRAGGSLAVHPGALPFECSVALPSWGALPELAEVVALARSGAIHVEVERLPLEETIEAYRRLRRGEVRGRAVAIPAHAESTQTI
jgi:propanol-preferring alcohol dehydrogenase